MRVKILTSFVVILVFMFSTSANNEKALKYLKLCLEKPASKYLFDHLYDSWNNEDVSLEEDLKKRQKQSPSPAWQRLLLALYEKEGRDSEALDACGIMLKKNPGDADLLLLKARLEFNGHNYDQCVKDLLTALKDKQLSTKNSVKIKKTLGRAWLRLDREKEALAVWKKLYADNNDPDFGEDILQLMLSEGLYEESMVLCKQLIKDCKNKFRSLELSIKLAEIYRLKGARKKAVASYRALLAETGTGSWLEKELFSRIYQIYTAEDDNAGLLKFTADFLQEYPARSAVRLRYIDLLFAGGETDKALAAYLELIKKSPLNQDYRSAYAKMLVKAEKYAQAIDVYAGLAKRFPKNSEFIFSKALVEIKAGKKAAALKDLDSYLALNQNSEYAYIRAGKVLENAEMDKEAGEFYKKFIEKFSGSVDAMETYALWLLRSKRTGEAVKLLTADKNLPLAILLRRSKLLLNYKQTLEVYNFLLRYAKEYKKDFRYNEELFAVCLLLSKQAEMTGLIPVLLNTAANWDELKRAVSTVCYALSKNNASEKYLQTLADEKKLSPNMRCLQAELQARYTGSDKAMATLDNTIKNAPRALMLYRQKAALLNSAGEYVQAAEAFRTLLKRDPKSRAEIYKRLIGLYERADNRAEAMKWAAKLKREFPDSALSWMLFARLQEEDSKPAEAIKTLGRAAYRFPDNDELRRQLVTAYSRKGDMRGAINICWKILRQSNAPGAKLGMVTQIYRLSNTENLKTELQNRLRLQMKNNPKDTFPLLALAEVAKLSYKYNEYRDYIRKASELGPKSLYLLNKLAEVDEEQGNYTAAENTLTRLCGQDKSGKAELKLADFYFRSGDDEKAMEIYRSYLRNHSDLNSMLRFAGDMIVRKRPEEAVAILKDQAVNSDNCILHYLLGCAYEDADNPELAVDEFTRVIKLSDTLKSKAQPPATGNNPWGVKFSPALDRLISIRRLYWQVYQYHQQQRYASHYSYYPGSTAAGILLPTSPESAVTMAICHLGQLDQKLSPEKQKELLKFLAACNIKYPELALMSANNNSYNVNIELKKILEKYPENSEVEFYLCMTYYRQLAQYLGSQKLSRLFFKLCGKYPEYSGIMINYAMQNILSAEDRDKLLNLIIDNLIKRDDLSVNNVYMLISALNNTALKLEQSRKKTIKDLAMKHFKKIRRENKIISPYIIYSTIQILLRNDFIADARELIKEELNAEIKNKSSIPTPYVNPYGRYPRPGQGLNFSKQVFPVDPMIKLPGIMNYAMQGGYRNDKKLRDSFFKACESVKDRRIELIAADGLGDKKNAEKIAADINFDPKSTLSESALSAAWYFKEDQPEKAYKVLLKAEILVKTKKDRKELNSRLISYALLIKDKKKVKKYVRKAAKRLLRMNLDVKEKVSLATVMQLAGLDEEAGEIESELLKKTSGSGKAPLSVSPHGSSRLDVYRRAEEKFKNKENEQALNLLLREYHYWFRQLYNSFSGNQPNVQLNPYQLTRVCELVKRYNCQDLMLKKLEPSAAAMQIKKCEYAYACQLLEKNKIAEKFYRETVEKNPKNRFAAFNYAMLLLKENYSAAVPVLKAIPLEDLILVSNNLHNHFTKADQILNFYELIVLKMKQEKKFNFFKINNQAPLFINLLGYLERNKYIRGENKNYPGVLDYLAKPEKYKDKFTKFIPRQQNLYLELCKEMTRIAPVAENAFGRELFLFKILKRDTASLFEDGLKLMRLLNKANVQIYHHNSQISFDNRSHQLPDFDSYMVITALKTKRFPELLEAAKAAVDSKSLTRQIQDLKELTQCPAAEFVAEAGKFIDREKNIDKRRDFQKMVVAIYQYRGLTSDLTPLMMKEVKLYDADRMQTQDRFAGLQAWIEATARRKDSRKLLSVLGGFADFYAEKYKKEFPEGTDKTTIQSRFHQVFPWMAINIFRNAMQNILNNNLEKWYPVYKGLKPLLEINMFARQLNTYNIFYQYINRDPIEFLKYSPFTGTFKEIDFCPLLQHDGRRNSLYGMTLKRIKEKSSWGKKVKEYLENLKKPNIGAELFEAALEPYNDKFFALLAAPELKFPQLSPEKQREFCIQLTCALANRTVSGSFTASSPGWQIYQLYKKFATAGNRERIEKFYKESVGNNYWNYTRKTGALIAEVAQNNPEEAAKIFEHALRKLKLFTLHNPNNRFADIQRHMLQRLRDNCHTLETCRVYYDCFSKTEKIQLDSINNFYDRLRYASETEFNKLRKNDNLNAMKLLLKKLEAAFKGSGIPLNYSSFNILHRLNRQHLQELIESREAGKDKSKIAEQINTILKLRLENSTPGMLKSETVEKMWSQIKTAPDVWRVACGLSIVNMPGGEIIAPYLAKPILKMTLEGDRQAKNHGLQLIIKKLALCKDDALVKKLAPSLINHYFLQLHSSPNRSGINDPDFFALVYRTGNQKLIKKLLDDFAMAEYTATYITLANLGDEKLIKSTLDKNWNKLKLSGNVKLSPDGLACAEKVCAAIKEPEEKYIAKVLFATPRVYRKDKDGKINYRQYNVQSAAFTKLANEFGNIKFSSKTNEIFCLQSLLSIHSDAGKIIAEKIPEKFLAFDVDTLVRLRNYNLSRQAGQVYFNCLMSGNSQAVFEKIKRLVELSRSSDNGIKNSVRNMLRGCSDAFFSKNLQEIKTEQVNDLAHLLLLLFNNMEDGYKAYPQSAFLIYLAGKQDELIKKLKSTPDNRRRVQTYLWNNQLRYMKSFCEKNKLEPRQKITDFLNSHLAREIFKNNAAALTEVQTSFVRESSDSFAGFKTYYDSLRANNKCSVNMINQFYSKLGQFIRKEYRRLKGNNRNQSPEAMRILFENYDKAFRDSDFTIRYNCLQLFTNLSKSQMRELINKRKALKNKSKSALRLDNILQAYLERNQSRRISPETTEKMWNDIKGLPENWRTALGLVLFRQRGGETLSRFLVAPVVKMVKDRKLASFYLRGLIYNIAIIDDKTLLKKIAPPLVDFYLGMVDKWDDNNCKNNRMAIAMSLNLAYRIDYIEQVKKFIAYPKINKYADVYICLANAGAEDILREALDKNWRGLSWPSRIVLFPDAAVLGRKLSAGFQKAEKKYISSVLFAGPAVYRQNKNGDINRYSSRGQKNS